MRRLLSVPLLSQRCAVLTDVFCVLCFVTLLCKHYNAQPFLFNEEWNTYSDVHFIPDSNVFGVVFLLCL